MTVRAWRIVKARRAAGAFSGQGAKAWGGRWNSPGGAVVYTAGSAALAMLEMLAHLQDEALLAHYVLFELTFDDALASSLPAAALPRAWRRFPLPAATQRIGDAWLAEARSAVLDVPSAILPHERNYLLNPAHRDYGQIAIGPQRSGRLFERFARPRR